MSEILIRPASASRFFFSDTESAWLWVIIRVYLGFSWLFAGWEKFYDSAWTSGNTLTTFLNTALTHTATAYLATPIPNIYFVPAVPTWYAYFLEHVVLPNTHFFTMLIPTIEVAIGLMLILGLFVGFSAFFGAFMNTNYLLAGALSTNPLMLVLSFFLIMAWRVAGWHGIDRFIFLKLLESFKPR